MRISAWSSDVCSSDLPPPAFGDVRTLGFGTHRIELVALDDIVHILVGGPARQLDMQPGRLGRRVGNIAADMRANTVLDGPGALGADEFAARLRPGKNGVFGHEGLDLALGKSRHGGNKASAIKNH